MAAEHERNLTRLPSLSVRAAARSPKDYPGHKIIGKRLEAMIGTCDNEKYIARRAGKSLGADA